MKSFLVSAEAEILMAQGRSGSAIDLLRPEAVHDEHLVGQLLEAFIQEISKSPDAKTRERLIKNAFAIAVPDRWRKNVPVQMTRARLAVAAGDRALFDIVIGNLSSTLINRSEIEKLHAQWLESIGRGVSPH
jgi:hypothetical protein